MHFCHVNLWDYIRFFSMEMELKIRIKDEYIKRVC